MPRITIPRGRALSPIQRRPSKDFTELIAQTESQNPLAEAVTQIGNVGSALVKRKALADQLSRLAESYDAQQAPGSANVNIGGELRPVPVKPRSISSVLSGMDPESAVSALQTLTLNRATQTPAQREAESLGLEKLRTDIEVAKRSKKYAIPQYDAKGNVIGFFDLPEGTIPFGGAKPSVPGGGSSKSVGVTPEGKAVIFDRETQSNLVDGKPYVGTILPTTSGSEEQRRDALVRGAKANISSIRETLTPQLLNELKTVQFTPGKVYGQLASPAAQALYTNLSEAVANQGYLKSGATLNPEEIERQTINYMAKLNQNPEDFLKQLTILEQSILPFSRGNGQTLQPLPAPGEAKKVGRFQVEVQ